MTDQINVTPGKQLSPEEKEKLAKENADSSAEAQRLAAEHRSRDMQQSGQDKPVAQSVADSIKGKLEREEFSKPE